MYNYFLGTLTGCKSSQEAILIEDPETRIYKKFDKEDVSLHIDDYENIDTEFLKDFYFKYLGYEIEEELRKSIQIQSNEDMIISFNPVIHSVSLNNSYILIIRNKFVKAVSTNPTKFVIPESFDLEKIITLEE